MGAGWVGEKLDDGSESATSQPDMKESVDPEPAPITPAGTELNRKTHEFLQKSMKSNTNLASPRQEKQLDDGSEADTSQLARIGKAVEVKMQEIGRPLPQSQNYKK